MIEGNSISDPISSRRAFIGTALTGISSGVLVSCDSTCEASPIAAVSVPDGVESNDIVYPLTKEGRDALSPEEIIARAMAGNARFREGRKRHRDFLVELQKTAGGQSPAAVILGCIDSRAPAELIFDLGLGDIFNCRIAGSVESPDVLGSMEFATKLSGAKVVAVIGHSACGAVRGAIAEAELGHLTQLLAKIRPAIKETSYKGPRTPDNPEYVDAVARKSVEMTVDRIRDSSSVIAELEKSNSIKLIGCFYDLNTGAIEIL